MITTILIIGVLNGLTLGVLLVTIRNGNPTATKMFGFILVLIALLILESLLIQTNVHLSFPHLLRTTDGVFLLILPALYFYAQLATGSKKRLEKVDLLHILPFLLFTFFLIPYYSLDGSTKLTYTESNNNEIAILGYLKALSGIIYFTLTTVHIMRFRKNVKENQLPPTNFQNVSWFFRILMLLIAIGLISLISFTLENLGITLLVDSDTTSSLLLTMGFYVNGFVLIRNPYILWDRDQTELSLSKKKDSKPKYRHSPLTNEQMGKYLQILLRQMKENKAYKNKDLNPKTLEEITGIKSYYITEVINTLLERNFYEFVNEYRVDEVKTLITDKKNNHITLLALAHEAGFNSKASFNRIFKIYVGMSPSAFKKKHSTR